MNNPKLQKMLVTICDLYESENHTALLGDTLDLLYEIEREITNMQTITPINNQEEIVLGKLEAVLTFLKKKYNKKSRNRDVHCLVKKIIGSIGNIQASRDSKRLEGEIFDV